MVKYQIYFASAASHDFMRQAGNRLEGSGKLLQTEVIIMKREHGIVLKDFLNEEPTRPVITPCFVGHGARMFQRLKPPLEPKGG